jgi:hypothetical protein
MRDMPFGVWLFCIAAIALVAALYLRESAKCDECPPGSRGVVVRGMWCPRCVCEVVR